jgi:hypothetical protein
LKSKDTQETSKHPAETQDEWDIGRMQQEMFGEIAALRSVKPVSQLPKQLFRV